MDTTFGVNGIVRVTVGTSYENLNAMRFQPDGKILVAGYTGSLASGLSLDRRFRFAIARLSADGALDPAFGSGGKVITPIGESAEIQANRRARGGRAVGGKARFRGWKVL